ncbi:uncharacterized protein ycf45 [Selaginella moellendorffii]|uniref:uncharacterized protein ycf45 n=1 Tax=Selaginella moellendorffii TaxID=88036 RepID=UPI000D1C6758|nr:uncharacterized protein ycf45 [Selaginella moellendorffii]XP_024516828.1 uncharacterized protein ycf45 [Selaginella moellendorffii]|eukprot:XP_024516827.1 uncharacterized protein ycf45 [Selaginella moellendorffii]
MHYGVCCPSAGLRRSFVPSERSAFARNGSKVLDSCKVTSLPRSFRGRRRVLRAVKSLASQDDELEAGPLEQRVMEDGAIIVQDDLDVLLEILPEGIRQNLLKHPKRGDLLEVVLDLGRRPEARFLKHRGGEYLRDNEITRDDLQAAEAAVGEFGSDNRAGIEGTLHRISAIRNRKGVIIGLTCRVGRAVTGHVDMVRDLLDCGKSILFLGRPGVGKTTVIREIARVLADDLRKRVVVVDTSNEIGGDGDVPHPAIGGARRMQVPDPSMQHRVMVEAVENHMPQVVIVDEIGTEAEALACRTIAERGVMLVATAHGQTLENIIKNPTLSDLVGGIQTVTLGDDEARARGTQKTVLERKAPPTFSILIEMRERSHWIAHQSDKSVDNLLQGKQPVVEMRTRDENFRVVIEKRLYDKEEHERSDVSSLVMASKSSIKLGSSLFQEENNWVSKIGYIPDKDAMAENWVNYMGKQSHSTGRKLTLEEEDQLAVDYGFLPPGKRGSKRGPRGIRPR